MMTIPAEDCIFWVKSIASFGVALQSLEEVWASNVYGDNALLTWSSQQLQSKLTSSGLSGLVLATVYRRRIFVALLLIRAMAAIGLLFLPIHSMLSPVLAMTVVCVCLLVHLRTPYGLDGAQQMYLIIFVALFCASICTPMSIGFYASIWFIAAQAILAYVVSGLFKIVSTKWRTGQALVSIFSTSVYGNAVVHKLLLKSTTLCFILSWFIITFETTFFVSLFSGPETTSVYLAIGIAFHWFNAVAMGLNNFAFAFIATYPAVSYCAGAISVLMF